MNSQLEQVGRLVNQLLDGSLSADEEQQLGELLRETPGAVDVYVGLMDIHARLQWGAAGLEPSDESADGRFQQPHDSATSTTPSARRLTVRWRAWGFVTAIAIVCAFLLPRLRHGTFTDNGPSGTVEPPVIPVVALPAADTPPLDRQPSATPEGLPSDLPQQPDSVRPAAEDHISVAVSVDDATVIAAVDRELAAVLAENKVQYSQEATPEEWIRRAWLTLSGRIPSRQEMAASLNHTQHPEWRRRLVEQLLQSPERGRMLAEVWTRLLLGRTERPGIDRDALSRWLESAFAANRPWNRIVADLIQAEGTSEQNGAANFLLAHLDNQATPATAVTARLFLGEQLQCVQCHNHPFASDLKQEDYWQLNAFFQFTERRRIPAAAPDSGVILVSLTDRRAAGMTFFETPRGRQQAVLPAHDGHQIAQHDQVARRAALAEFLITDSQRRVARAIVNRTWADFFGFGFTNPIDDMGKHAVVSHPRVLDQLTDAFVATGYDLRRLQTWIALSQAWRCSSGPSAGNQQDAPEAGLTPLFSRVYVRRMSPEQVYDSVLTAVRSVGRRSGDRMVDGEHRRSWVQRFARPYHTDENDETDEFDGGVAQAMAMMNGLDVNGAIGQAVDALLQQSDSVSTEDVLNQVCLSVLTRHPTADEERVFRRQLKRLRRQSRPGDALRAAAEDMLWAYLNSSEFQLVH